VKLSRERILEAALRLVEREGVEVLTMRRLADETGTAPMSLYRHVADKREVLSELLDLVTRRLTDRPPSAHPDPRQRVIDTVTGAHRLLEANRWVIHAVLALGELPPRALHVSEQVFAALRELGLDEETAVQAHTAIWHYMWGHVLFGHLYAASAQAYEEAGGDDFPELTRVMPAMRRLRSRDHFQTGLGALIDGFTNP
jgi:AcrR family transcriptional regulator